MERWAELRREHFVAGLDQGVGAAGRDRRNTVRGRFGRETPPRYQRPRRRVEVGSVQAGDPRLLSGDPRLPGVRVRELIEPLGCTAERRSWMTICARCGRCSCARGRFSGRSIGRARCASSICGSPEGGAGRARPDPAGMDVVVACLGYSRAGAGALVFSKETEDLLGDRRCLWSLGALPESWCGIGRPGCTPRRAPDGRVRRVLWAAEGGVAVLRAVRPPSQGCGRAAAGIYGDELRAGPAVCERARLPGAARRLVCQGQRADAQDAARPPGRPAVEEREVMAPLPPRCLTWPALGDARPARPLSAGRHQRLLARPGAGRPPRRGPRRSAPESSRACWTPASSPCRHERVFAKHRTITALEHARALRDRPSGREGAAGGDAAAGPL